MGSCFQGPRAALYRVFGFRIGPLSIVPWRRLRMRELEEADPKAERSENSSQSYEGDQEYQDQLDAVLDMNRENRAETPPPPQGPAGTAAEEMNRLLADYQNSLRRTEVEIQLQGLLYERIRQLEQERNQLLDARDEPVEDHQGGMDEVDADDSTDEENDAFQRQLQAQAERHARELEQVRRRKQRN